MATIHFHETMHAIPERFVAARNAFGPGRSQLFANSGDRYEQGPVDADVTEGSHGIWERLTIDGRSEREHAGETC